MRIRIIIPLLFAAGLLFLSTASFAQVGILRCHPRFGCIFRCSNVWRCARAPLGHITQRAAACLASADARLRSHLTRRLCSSCSASACGGMVVCNCEQPG
jgi:hypothetical protein